MGGSAIGVPARSFFTGLYPQYNTSSAAIRPPPPFEPDLMDLERMKTTVMMDGSSYYSVMEFKAELTTMTSSSTSATTMVSGPVAIIIMIIIIIIIIPTPHSFSS